MTLHRLPSYKKTCITKVVIFNVVSDKLYEIDNNKKYMLHGNTSEVSKARSFVSAKLIQFLFKSRRYSVKADRAACQNIDLGLLKQILVKYIVCLCIQTSLS